MEKVISEKYRKMLEAAYYKDGMCFGRDGMYYYLKERHKDHPSQSITLAWLKKQKIQQEFAQTRKGGMNDYFHPVEPFHSISADLLDYTNKPARNYRYVLVVVDNFSRKMFVRATTAKEADKIAPAMKSILEDIKKEPNNNISNKTPKYVITDDGGEFKGNFLKVMKEYDIEKRRTIGGHPEQNGLVERANGKIKMLIAKNQKINGGSWVDNLDKSLNAYNVQYNRMTKYSPSQALDLKGEDQKKLIQNVDDRHKLDVDYVVLPAKFKVADKVRVKLNKGTLGKSSTPSWSSTIYTIGKIIKPRLETIGDKFKIKELAQDQTYTRNDLQLVKGIPEGIPIYIKEKQKKQEIPQMGLSIGEFTKAGLEEEKRENRPERDRKKPKSFRFEVEGKSDTKRREFEIEKIVDVKKEGRINLYKVRWKGYGEKDDTWEPKKNLAGSIELLKEFGAKRAKLTPSKKPPASPFSTPKTAATQKLNYNTPPRRNATQKLIAGTPKRN